MTKNNESSSTSSYEAIEKLVALKEKGALTQEEFDSEKKKILGGHQNTETKTKPDKAETPQVLKNALRFGATILFFSALIGGGSGYGSLIWILLPLWYIRWAPNKKYSHKFFEKFTHRKLYLGRIFLSILFVFIALPIAIDSLKFKAQATKFEQEKANTPTPTITVTSEIPELVSGNEYVLTFDVVNGDIVKVDNQNPEKVGESSYKTNITLDIPSKSVTISARNKHHVQNQNVVVKRQPTPEEQEIIKAEEEKQKQVQAEQEKKRLEKQKKQEEYLKSPEYKAKLQNERLNKVIADRDSDMKFVCTEGVKSMLKSPSSADFPSILEFRFGIVGEQIGVQSYVDSQNSFGAQMRTEFICLFNVGTDGTPSIADIKFDE